VLKYQYIFQTKYTEAFLNSTRKQLWFDITKMLIAVYYAKNYCVIYYNFRHTFVPEATERRVCADNGAVGAVW